MDFDIKVNDKKETVSTVQVKIKKLHPDAIIPTYGTEEAMGMDITAIDCEYNAEKDCFIYHTGLAIELPKGYGAWVCPQSRNRNSECYIPNTPGIVDADFRGEFVVTYKTRSPFAKQQPYKVGEKVGQLVIMPYPKIEFIEVNELTETKRGIGGHGSTGK